MIVSKLIFYLGFVVATGHALFAYGKSFNSTLFINNSIVDFHKLTLSFVLIAVFAVIVWFFATIGLMAEDGFLGAFDPVLAAMMWSSVIGESALYRGGGLIVVALLVMVSWKFKLNKLLSSSVQLLMIVTVLLLSYSFTKLGHISELEVTDQLLLIFHVCIMAWWFGALYPLKLACLSLDDDKLIETMECFGRHAFVMVTLSLMVGVLLAVELIGSVEALFNTSYGLILLGKVSLVVIILCVAARNKLRFVPAIRGSNGRALLSKSISIEIIVALSILVVTAILTTVVGPTP
ncbi:CopD family protein [Alteromonas sp. ASW11-36]|uniref:Copper resistance protein D n=1 Tax=Alteromonas arenosi TaxID=3055817 RepID=A0ABT7SVZ6_9ALTE|nr:CopD family protein [Alteromonas sp. ASW11-36]MDM7860368.1 CopD family protein [Alteromonas sp. ASW11-36]